MNLPEYRICTGIIEVAMDQLSLESGCFELLRYPLYLRHTNRQHRAGVHTRSHGTVN